MSLVTACVDSSEEAAQTPADAPTVANSALQTNSKGETVTAPGATAPVAAETDGATGGEAPAGDVAAGEQVFAASCTACHMNNGLDAGGIGPQLAGRGVDDAAIRNIVQNGRGSMPPGLISGADLDNAVAYILSIQ